MPSDAAALAYSDLLSREPWHWFATLTFAFDHQRASGGMHPEKADKAFRYFIGEFNRHLYGNNWRRIPHGGLVWARGHEFHKDGRSHFHTLLAAPNADLNCIASRYYWHEWWYRKFGRNQIEKPRSQDEVRGYVSKYVTKDGEVDVSRNFGEARPPSILEGYEQAGKLEHEPAQTDEHFRRLQDRTKDAVRQFLSLTLQERLQRPLLNQTHLPPTQDPQT